MLENKDVSSINEENWISIIKKIFSHKAIDPYSLYQSIRTHLDLISKNANCFIQVAILSPDGDIILPIVSLPLQSDPKAILSGEIVALSSIGKNLKMIKRGEKIYKIIRKAWLVNRLLGIEGAAYFEKTTHDKRLEDKHPIEYNYRWYELTKKGRTRQKSYCQLLIPFKIEEDHPYSNVLDRFYAYATKLPAQPGGSELILFALYSTWEYQKGKAKQIEKIEKIAIDIKGINLLLLGWRIADEIRSQISTMNSRYIGRYYQIKLGLECVKKVLKLEKISKEFESFLMNFLIENEDLIVVRNILRNLRKEEKLWSKFFKLSHKWKIQNDLEDYIANISLKKVARRKNMLGTKKTRLNQENKVGQCILSSSSRGGVGKTIIALAYANYLGHNDESVCFLEMDIPSPTLYYLSNRLRRKKTDPWISLMKKFNRADGKDISEESVMEAMIDEPELNIKLIGALPPEERTKTAEMLTRADSIGYFKKFIPLLIAKLKKSFEWIVIDTPAGFRDITATLANLDCIDLNLIFATPVKSSLMNVVKNISMGREGLAQILVLNKARYIDKELFGSKEGIFDFMLHNKLSQNHLDFFEVKKDVEEMLEKCHGVCSIGWFEGWERIEDIDDINKEMNAIEDIRKLSELIKKLLVA